MEKYNIDLLKRDLALRGYTPTEIEELLNFPILIIPGILTPLDAEMPVQKLTDQLVIFYKGLQIHRFKTRLAVAKNMERVYVEERHAFVDLGTICIALQTLGNLADLATVMDLILTVIQLRFSKKRNEQLMPIVKYRLEIHNEEKSFVLDVEGRVDQLKEIVPTDKVINAIAKEVLK